MRILLSAVLVVVLLLSAVSPPPTAATPPALRCTAPEAVMRFNPSMWPLLSSPFEHFFVFSCLPEVVS